MFFVVLLLGACSSHALLVGNSRPGTVVRIRTSDGRVQWRDTYGEEVNGMYGFRRGPASRLYVCSYRTGKVLRFRETLQRPEGVYIEHERLVGPTDLIFLENGDALVACSGSTRFLLDEEVPSENAALLRFSGPKSKEPGAFLGAVGLGDNFGNPTCLATGPDGATYVGGRNHGSILRIAADGAVTEFADVGDLLPRGAMHIAFNDDGLLYATSPFATIVVVMRDGVFFKLVDDPEIGKPAGVAIGKDGALYVASYDRGELRKYDVTTGKFSGVVVDELAAPWTVRVR